MRSTASSKDAPRRLTPIRSAGSLGKAQKSTITIFSTPLRTFLAGSRYWRSIKLHFKSSAVSLPRARGGRRRKRSGPWKGAGCAILRMARLCATNGFPPAHLERLPNLTVEITGGLGELRQRGDCRKPFVAHNRAIRKIAHPAPFQGPDLLRLRPPRARCKDTALDLKCSLIDLQHREPTKKVMSGVEKIVIVDF